MTTNRRSELIPDAAALELRTPSLTSVIEEALRKVLSGGVLEDQVKRIVQQEVALVLENLAESREPHLTTVGRQAAKIVSRFDPDEPEADITRWLETIEHLARAYGWSDEEKTSILRNRLRGSAKTWFDRRNVDDHPWAEWKAKLNGAFPKRRDFADMLEEMVNRHKRAGETMTAYFHKKLGLCERVDITDEKAVSCIIHGLPEELQADAHASKSGTPEELYNCFLVDLEVYKPPVEKRPHRSREKKRTAQSLDRPSKMPRTKLQRCFNCQRWDTHLSKDCPMPRLERCTQCGETGHTITECTHS